jgi:hypothetical protein
MSTVSANGADLRARRRRRVLRKARRKTVKAVLKLAQRTERVPSFARALRAGTQRFEHAVKRLELVVAPRPARDRPVGLDWDSAEALHEYRTLLWMRTKQCVTVDQPLALITQAPRSGGTLLMRLFDGHPQCHAVPHELGTLLPAALPLPRGKAKAWNLLTDPRLGSQFELGLRQSKGSLAADSSARAFLLPPLLHRGLFEHCLRRDRPESDRGILDCYLTAYFNAWLDYRGFSQDGQLWVTGFEPSAIASPERLICFRELYPDGKLVSIVRDPSGWLVSAQRRNERYADRDVALEFWRGTVEAALAAKRERPEAVAIVSFESLVGDTERTMRAIAGFLGIEFTSDLLTPTFNGEPMKANSSFPVEGPGVIEAPLTRGELLPPDDVQAIELGSGPLYERALEVALVTR